MALIKIRMRKELITVDNVRGKKVKLLRFGDVNGKGKADPQTELDLGDEWCGTVGMVEWVEIGKEAKPAGFRIMRKASVSDRVFQVPLNYTLQAGEEFV